MADNSNIPTVFVRVEEGYRQEAWLSLVMGKALYIDCFDTSMVDTAFPKIAKRVSDITKQNIKANALTPRNPNPPLPPTPKLVAAADNNVMTFLETMKDQLQKMSEDIAELKAGMKQLQLDVKNITKA